MERSGLRSMAPAGIALGRHARRLHPVAMSILAGVLIVGTAWYSSPASDPGGGVVSTYTPAWDGETVEQLPPESAASKRDLRERTAALSRGAQTAEGAAAMARRHYERALRYAEPRESGLARSALGQWWDRPDAPVPVLLIRAAIRQHEHDFAGALGDLRNALAADPSSIQAWLSQAAILQTVGRLEEATGSCRRVAYLSGSIAGQVCLADLASLQGDATALDRIGRQLDHRRLADAERRWVMTVAAEMAERLGRNAEAERYFREAMAGDTTTYTRVAYADFLLQQGRAGEVEALLLPSPPTDAVLLRRALAMKRTGDPRTAAATADLRGRFDSAAGRAESPHLREMARFALEVEGDVDAAVDLARRNWLQQKEPADALLLARAARAAGRPGDAEPVRAFVREAGLLDVRLHELL